MQCDVGSKVEEKGFLVSPSDQILTAANSVLWADFCTCDVAHPCRQCLKMSVVLVPGTGGGVSYQDTASPIGHTLTMRGER